MKLVCVIFSLYVCSLLCTNKAGAFHSNCWELKAFLPQMVPTCQRQPRCRANVFSATRARLVLLGWNECYTLQSSHWSCLLDYSQSVVSFPTLTFLTSLLNCSQSSGEEKKEGWRSSLTTVASHDLAGGCRHLWLNDVRAALSLLPLEMNYVAPFSVVFCTPCLCFVSLLCTYNNTHRYSVHVAIRLIWKIKPSELCIASSTD